MTSVNFQTQKQDCGALLYLHVFLFQHLAQRCNTTRCIHTHTDARTHTNKHKQTRIHSSNHVSPSYPGRAGLRVETLRGLDTHSPPRLTTLHTPSSLLSRAARRAVFFISTPVEKTQVCVCRKEKEKETRARTHTHTTHTGSCVYRFGAVTRGCAVIPLLLPPL